MYVNYAKAPALSQPWRPCGKANRTKHPWEKDNARVKNNMYENKRRPQKRISKESSSTKIQIISWTATFIAGLVIGLFASQAEWKETYQAKETRVITVSKRTQIPPELEVVAWCESKNRQYDEEGNVLIGVTGDIGIMQINPYAHGEQAQKLGINIYSKEGNIKYAIMLYEQQGLKPWKSSEKCWRKMMD